MKNILCFGDSNTWGYNPVTKQRYPRGIRWTSLLQDKLKAMDVNIIEQGLCGRTTVFEDAFRPYRKGVDALKKILEKDKDIDFVVLMLGTNDCKTIYHNTADEIAEGVSKCLDVILEYVEPANVLLLSPIELGHSVWRAEYDPEFNQKSVFVSKKLKEAYTGVAKEKGVNFMAASDYALPSVEDQEHMNEEGHGRLAKAIYQKIQLLGLKTAV